MEEKTVNRSYIVRTETGRLRRNRRHLRPLPEVEDDISLNDQEGDDTPHHNASLEPADQTTPALPRDSTTAPPKPCVMTRSGRVCKAPERLKDYVP